MPTKITPIKVDKPYTIRDVLKKLPPDEQKKAKRLIRITLARKSFWLFCKAIAPDFYKDNRPHLRTICDTLQALYEKRIWKVGYEKEDDYGFTITRPKPNEEWQIAENKADIPEGAYICKDLMMNIPPRHGKSRTLIYFECWIYGQNPKERVITVSYNALIAEEFSRFVRDEIMKEANEADSIVMHDIFPWVEVKEDDASVTKWSLKGNHFSYLGTGMQGSTTSKGGTVQVIDDPIKDSVTAQNEVELDAQYEWVNNTFLSRTDAVGGESINIVNMTRWASRDICGRLLSDLEEKDCWFVLKMTVMNEKTGEMLCEDILNRSKYYQLKNRQTTSIFRANYFQEPLDIQGRLYQQFFEYDVLPNNVVAIKAECDPADTGKDYLCMIVYAETADKFAYVLDIIYNDNKVEITIPLICKSLIANKAQKLTMESNSGGRLLGNNIKQRLEEMGWHRTIVNPIPTTSSQNKQARINNMSEVVQTRIFMPKNWSNRFDNFYKDVFKYISGGKNAHDDGPDCLTRVAERLTEGMGQMIVNRSVIPQVIDSKTVTQATMTQPVLRVARVIRR